MVADTYINLLVLFADAFQHSFATIKERVQEAFSSVVNLLPFVLKWSSDSLTMRLCLHSNGVQLNFVCASGLNGH